MALVDEHHNGVGRLYVHSAVGLLELGLGRVEEAIGALEGSRALAERHELGEPNVVRWRSDLIEAYVRAGDIAAAHEALDALDPQAQHTGGRWALGTAARCRGLLTDGPAQGECFTTAVDRLRQVPEAFEIARTYLCQGSAAPRTDARRALRLAIEDSNDWEHARGLREPPRTARQRLAPPATPARRPTPIN